MANHYKTLGIEKSAAPAEIDEAFLRLKKKAIETGSNSPEIDIAYSVLANASERKAYDNAQGAKAGDTKTDKPASRRKLFIYAALAVFVYAIVFVIANRNNLATNRQETFEPAAAPAAAPTEPTPPPPVLEASEENPNRWIDVGDGPKNSDIKYRSIGLDGLPSTLSADLMELKLAAQDDPKMQVWAQLYISYCDEPAVINGAFAATCHLHNINNTVEAITVDSEARRKLLGAVTKEAFMEGMMNGIDGRAKTIALKGMVASTNGGGIVVLYK